MSNFTKNITINHKPANNKIQSNETDQALNKKGKHKHNNAQEKG